MGSRALYYYHKLYKNPKFLKYPFTELCALSLKLFLMWLCSQDQIASDNVHQVLEIRATEPCFTIYAMVASMLILGVYIGQPTNSLATRTPNFLLASRPKIISKANPFKPYLSAAPPAILIVPCLCRIFDLLLVQSIQLPNFTGTLHGFDNLSRSFVPLSVTPLIAPDNLLSGQMALSS